MSPLSNHDRRFQVVTREPVSLALPRRVPVLAALAYAERVHAGQRREVDGAPFILHPLEVGSLLYPDHAADRVIAAGILHDTLEKTDADADDLATRFGRATATLVCAVSEDKRIIDYEERKAALREQVAEAGREALTIFAADKV